LDTPENGTLLYDGRKIEQINSLSRFRREYIGFVFQFHHLLPVLTLRENVETALLFHAHMNKQVRKEAIEHVFFEMGLSSKIDTLATEVSGGERQRAAIARALVGSPRLILADEPTGNVDSVTSEKIMKALHQRIKQTGATALIATHDPTVSAFADVILSMQDGKITAVKDVWKD
jgi:ABC-type lipoprotein export system ATPase subunit